MRRGFCKGLPYPLEPQCRPFIRVEGQQYTVWIHPLSDWRAAGDATLSIGVDGKSPR